jgi:hypothetical protein
MRWSCAPSGGFTGLPTATPIDAALRGHRKFPEKKPAFDPKNGQKTMILINS